MPSACFSFVRQFFGSSLPVRHRRPAQRVVKPFGRWSKVALLTTPLLATVLIGTAFAPAASAATTVQLGTATPFAVLGATAVTNVPTSSITGDVGLSPGPGTAYAGITQSQVNGTIYTTDGTGPTGNDDDPGLLTDAQNDLTTAYLSAAAQTPTTTFLTGDNQLGGQTLVPGVYAFGGATTANLTGPLTLNAQGDPSAVFIFQASSTLVTASNSSVLLENGAQACNVFWQVGSSATLNTATTFVGTIMALTSDTLDTGTTVQGRVLASTGAVTLDDNVITVPSTCATTTSTGSSPTTTTTPTATGGSTGTGGTSGTATGAVTTGSTTSSGEGSTGTGSAAGGGGAATIPSGSPHTGFGGAAHSRDNGLIVIGSLALLASLGMLGLAVRRSRAVAGRMVLDDS
jgi:hypothetical protein